MPKRKRQQSTPTVPPSSSKQVPEAVEVGDRPTFYANRVSGRATAFDFDFRFQDVYEATSELLKAKELVRIQMAPVQAKAFSSLLSRLVEDYEKKFGVVAKVSDLIIQSDD